MPASDPVILQITFTPQEQPAAPTAQTVRDWVAREAEALTPLVIDHTTDDGQPACTTYTITAVELANG